MFYGFRMNAYTEEREYLLNLVIEKKTRITGDNDKGDYLKSYLEDYGALIPSCLDGLEIEHLEALEEVIFSSASRSEGVVFVFRYAVSIAEKMNGWEILPSEKFEVRLFRPVKWVDRY